MKEQYDKSKENLIHQKELLSMLINNNSLYIQSIDIIRPEMFTDIYRIIFDGFVKLITEQKKPDVFSLSRIASVELSVITEIATFYSGSQSSINSILFELYEFMASSEYSKLAAYISTNVTNGTESEKIKENILLSLRSLEFGTTSKVVNMTSGVSMLYKIIENNRKELTTTGTRTGFKIIDKHMGGLQRGDYIVLAGESSHGKTSMAMSMMFNSAVMFNEPCGIISHEMTPDKIMARFAGMATNISSKHILTGKMSDSEIQQFSNNINKLIRANIFIQDFIKNTLIDTVSAIRLMTMQHHVKYIVIENAGNITVKGIQEDERRTAEISKTLASVAKELGITVILISHLNRDRDKKRQPDLSRLRHSGQLEFDADVVMFIYMPSLHGYETFDEALSGDPSMNTDNMAKVYIAKGRNYGLAESFCTFTPMTTYVSDIAEHGGSQMPVNNDFDTQKTPF